MAPPTCSKLSISTVEWLPFRCKSQAKPPKFRGGGNGTLDIGEQCDDDNVLDGDGCQSFLSRALK